MVADEAGKHSMACTGLLPGVRTAIAPAEIHCACLTPLTNGQRPVSRKPPSSGTTLPIGATTTAARGGRGPPYICATASSFMKAPGRPDPEAPTMAHQDAEGFTSAS